MASLNITEGGDVSIINKTYRGAVVIPEYINGVKCKNVNSYGFQKSNIESIDLSQTAIISNGFASFSGCQYLKTVIFSNKYTYIGQAGFHSCPLLNDVHIPASVTTIFSDAFYNCSSLTNITIDTSNSRFLMFEGNLITKNNDLVKLMNFTTVVDLPYIERIGSNAFSFAKVDKVIFHENLTFIADYAFLASLQVKFIDISMTNVKQLTLGTFQQCPNLETVLLPNLTRINDRAFFNLASLNNIYLPESLEIINPPVFYECPKLKNIYYAGFKNLTSVNIFYPNTIKRKIIVNEHYPYDKFASLPIYGIFNNAGIVAKLALEVHTCNVEYKSINRLFIIYVIILLEQ